MDYNVVENTYRLNLMEFIADDSWRIDVSIAEVGDYFITDISSLAFNFDGTSPDDTIGISTNVTWEVSTNVFWAGYRDDFRFYF